MDEDKLFNELMKQEKEDLASYLVGLLSELPEEALKEILEDSNK